jgi:hypothetical protein
VWPRFKVFRKQSCLFRAQVPITKKNIGLITEKLQNFSFADIKCISNFNLSFQEEYNVHSSLLGIDFIIEGNGNGYLVQFRFHNPQSISFESGGLYHQISLNIEDITERG